MSTLSLKHIFKMYPNNSKGKTSKLDYAVKDFNLEILDGEFVVFVGPSGCGKSTTLRMIAGLEDITAGELYIDEELSNNKEPKDRNVAMVFQSYALYPNMTAYNNIAFALKMRKKEVEVLDKDGNKILIIDKKKIKSLIKNNKILNKRISQSRKLLDIYKQKVEKEENKDLYLAKIDFEEKHILEITKELNKNIENIEYYSNNLVPKTTFIKMSKDEIDEKIQSVAEILEITKLLDRKPSDMSGGQRQRVALGRAMVREPKVFLLDEPLSNLDAKLRTAMRSEIVKLHEKVKTTFIYVTHDQVEAMTMGTKIVVMKDGLIMQVDTPTNLYDYPNNKFVAGFIGTPQMNFFEVTVKKVNRSLKITFNDNQELSFGLNKLRKINNLYLDGNEHKVYLGIRAEHLSLNKTGIKTKLSITEVLGNVTNLFVHLENDKKDFIVSVNDRLHYESGHELFIEFNPSNIHLFDYENELSIMEGEAK